MPERHLAGEQHECDHANAPVVRLDAVPLLLEYLGRGVADREHDVIFFIFEVELLLKLAGKREINQLKRSILNYTDSLQSEVAMYKAHIVQIRENVDILIDVSTSLKL